MTTKHKALFPILTVTVAIIISLFISEVAVSYFSPQNRSGSWFIYSRYRYHLNKSGGNARHQSGNRVVYYHFNDYHLRGGPIKNNVQKVLVLGDSFTFGWLLNEEDTYVYKLQIYADKDLGPNILQFLNGGVAAWGTADYLAFIEEYGEVISPNIIIVFFNTDDIGRSLKLKLYKVKNAETLEMEKEITHQNDVKIFIKNITQNLPFYQFLLEHFNLLQLVRNSFFHINNLMHKRNPRSVQENIAPSSTDLNVNPSVSQLYGKALFHRLKNWCDSHKVQLIVLTTGYFSDKGNNAEPTIAFYSIASDFFKQENIRYHDISQKYMSLVKSNQVNYCISSKDGHPNEKGSQIIAESAWNWLKSVIPSMLKN